MDAIKEFREERRRRIKALKEDSDFAALSDLWTKDACDANYQYNFDWLGRPIIQFPNIYRFSSLVEGPYADP